MRLRSLPAVPLLYGALFLGLSFWLQGNEALPAFLVGQRILVRLLAVVGCFAAVSVFEPGDHLRRAWRLLGWGTLVILTRDVLRLFPSFQAGSAGPGAQAVLTGLGLLSNLALLGGIWQLARSWKMAAITLPGGRMGVTAVSLVTAAFALLVVGPGALEQARVLAGGDWSVLVLVVSAGVDIITLCLITPLLLTALSMRGGLFSWPWGLVTASQLSWLLYDAAAGLPPGFLGGLPVAELGRGLAEVFLFVAGLAQALVIRQVRRGF